MGGVGALILLVVIVGLVTGSPAPTTTAAAAPTPTTNPPPALQRTPEQAFVGDVLDTPGLSSSMSESDMIGIGRGACEVMAYQQFSRADLIAQLGQSKYGPQVMEVFVDAAHRNLCPQYAFPSVSIGGAVATAAAPTAGSSTANTVSDGTYLVGEDLTAGTWKTSGGSGGSACYWARLKDDAGSNIIANNYGSGPARFTAKKGEYVQLSGGCSWTKQG